MEDKIPDLKDSYVDEPLCYYNLAQGYMCPDSVEGFDDVDGYKDGDIICPFVKIPFDQALADTHILEPKKQKREVLDEQKVTGVVGEELDDDDEAGFAKWLEHDGMGKSKTVEEAVYQRERARRLYESWKDNFVLFCPVAMSLPCYKGDLLLIFYL